MYKYLNRCKISGKEFVFRIYKELLQNDKKKTIAYLKKWSKELNRHFIKIIFKWLIQIWKGGQCDWSAGKSKLKS